jgi:hypothetical protein
VFTVGEGSAGFDGRVIGPGDRVVMMVGQVSATMLTAVRRAVCKGGDTVEIEWVHEHSVPAPAPPPTSPCPNDTDGDGNCGRASCPACGRSRAR